MNHSSTLTLTSTALKIGKPAVGCINSFDAFSSHPSDDNKTAGASALHTAKELASTLKPAISRVIESDGALAKDTAAAAREAAGHAKRRFTGAETGAETYVNHTPTRSVATAAVHGAATATLVLTKRPPRSFVRVGYPELEGVRK